MYLFIYIYAAVNEVQRFHRHSWTRGSVSDIFSIQLHRWWNSWRAVFHWMLWWLFFHRVQNDTRSWSNIIFGCHRTKPCKSGMRTSMKRVWCRKRVRLTGSSISLIRMAQCRTTKKPSSMRVDTREIKWNSGEDWRTVEHVCLEIG